MENKYIVANLVILVMFISGVGVFGYFVGVRVTNQQGLVFGTLLSPTPTVSVSPYTSPLITPTPTPSPRILTSVVTPTPPVSGISGLVILDCNPIPLVEVRISDSNNNTIRTVVTGADGRFRTELTPATYIVGPFREPKSGAIVNASQVVVNRGNFSEIRVTFKSQ